MSGLKLEELSTNWKKLQGQLQTKKKDPAKSNGVKRKRTETEQNSANGIKKPRIRIYRSKKEIKGRKMGLSASRPEEPATNSQHGGNPLATKPGLTNGNNTTSPLKRDHIDSINSGIHPHHRAGKYTSLDCEMVGTGTPPHYTDNILARVSLVNFHGEQLYDTYVLPPPGTELTDIKDYRTFVSGITPAHIQPGVARPFKDVQREVAGLLDGRILVGHALRNDLAVLMLSHPKRDMRDTSRYGPFRAASGGRPPSLRVLARRELGWEIQGGEHSSLEDARAAMGLFRKEKGGFEEEVRRRFGTHVSLTQRGMGRKGVGIEARKGESEEDDRDDDVDDVDPELLDGEEDDVDVDGEEGTPPSKTSTPKPKKKTKKKKRTKRK